MDVIKFRGKINPFNKIELLFTCKTSITIFNPYDFLLSLPIFLAHIKDQPSPLHVIYFEPAINHIWLCQI